MTTIDVSIPYGDDVLIAETVKAEAVWGDEWELREHTGFAPLAPGDRVRVNAASELIEIVRLEPTYVYCVWFHLPADTTFGKSPTAEHPAIVALAALEEEWRRDTWVTRTTGFTMNVSSPGEQWFQQKVVGHPFVENTELLRTPSTIIDLADMLAHPHFGGEE